MNSCIFERILKNSKSFCAFTVRVQQLRYLRSHAGCCNVLLGTTHRGVQISDHVARKTGNL